MGIWYAKDGPTYTGRNVKRQLAQCVAIVLCSLSICGRATAQSMLSNENREEFANLLRVQNTQKALTMRSVTSVQPPASTLDRLLSWSRIALEATALDHTPVEPGSGDDPRRFAEQLGPHRSSYAMAIVHIAMFEAVNAVYQEYKSYTGFPQSDPAYQKSPVIVDRAIAQAAHDALISLYPYQKDRLDALLSIDIARMPKAPRVPDTEIQTGADLGSAAAASILQKRLNDNSNEREPEYRKEFTPKCTTPSGDPCPGIWSPDPVSNLKVALGANWSHVRPFVLKSADQFRPPAPPALDSPEYAKVYSDVVAVGGDGKITQTTRRDFQEFEGLFWAYDGTPALCAPPRLYNQVADTVALERQLGGVSKFARFLALINTAMADAAIAAWEAKYYYQLWRPVTAIRAADKDNNDATAPDPNWTPLGAPATNARGPNFTPPFPAYPSGHAVFGGAVFETLRILWPEDGYFTFVSDEYNGLNYPVGGTKPRPNLPQSFVSFDHAAYSNGRSRIWLGIHWQFDADAGIAQGKNIAHYVFENAFQPVAP